MIKVQYDSETGAVIGGHNSENQNIPTPNIEVTEQAWADANAQFMVPSVDLNTLQLVVTEVHDYEKEFSVETFQTGLFGIITQLSDPSLRWDFGALNTFATNKDFAGMKQYVQTLISAGAATEDDYDLVNGVTKAQNIDLDTY